MSRDAGDAEEMLVEKIEHETHSSEIGEDPKKKVETAQQDGESRDDRRQTQQS